MIVLLRKESPRISMDSMAEQPLSRLLLLPAEIRVAIWEMLLIHHQEKTTTTTTTTTSSSSSSPSSPSFFPPASLLRTCKQINHETTPILYQSNTFLAHPTLLASLPSFLLKVHPTRQTLPPVLHSHVTKLIKHFFIHVRLDIDPRFSSTQAKESFTGLDSLEIEVFQSMYGSCDFTNLRLFEAVRGVGRAVVQGSIGDGKYARWLQLSLMTPLGREVSEFSEDWIGGSESWSQWRERHTANR